MPCERRDGPARPRKDLPSDKKNAKAEPPTGWQDKRCAICEKRASDPCSLDRKEGRDLRKWGLRQYWGELCWWCSRMAIVKFAHWQTSRLVKWIGEASENRVEARVAAIAYISLREEGRTQIAVEHLQAPSDLLIETARTLPSMLDSTHSEVCPLAEFAEAFPGRNLVQERCEVVQAFVGGSRRLAIKYAAPIAQAAVAPKSREGFDDVLIADCVHSDRHEDWKLLASFAASAVARTKEVPLPSPTKNAGMSCSSPAVDSSVVSPAPSGGGLSPAMLTPMDAYEWPKTRLANAVKKNLQKAQAAMGFLINPKWQTVLKEPTLRGQMRSVAGSNQELMESDNPMLLQRNEVTIKHVGDLIKLCSAVHLQSKAGDAKSWLRFVPVVDELAEGVKQIFGDTAKLDAELLVIQALLVGRTEIYASMAEQEQMAIRPIDVRRFPENKNITRAITHPRGLLPQLLERSVGRFGRRARHRE